MRAKPRLCECKSGNTWSWIQDAFGMPLCRTCPACHERKVALYRPDIFLDYEPTSVIEQPIKEAPDPFLAKGLEDGFVGSVFNPESGGHLAVYDIQLCVAVLQKGGFSETEAYEHLDYNVIGAWVGSGTPLFLRRQTMQEFYREQDEL